MNSVDLQDKLHSAQYLVEAAYLAAGSLGNKLQTNALQAVCAKASKRLDELAEMLEQPEPIRMTGGARS